MLTLFRDLDIAKKIGFLVILSLLFTSIIGFTGYLFLSKSNDTVEDMYNQKLIPTQLMNENRVHQRVIATRLLELMLTTDNNEKKKLVSEIQERATSYSNNVDELTNTKLDDNQKKMMQEIDDLIKKFRTDREKVIALAMSNNNAEAYDLYFRNVRQTAELSNNKVKELAEYTKKQAEAADDQNNKNADKAITILITTNLLSLVILTIIGTMIGRVISNPLKELTEVANDAAAGNLVEKQRTTNSKDEVGQLSTSICTMINNLRTLIQKVASSSQQLAAASEQLTASTEQSALASSQVAESVTDVSTGTTRQQTSIEECSRSISQISTRIQQAAMNVSQVTSLSEKAAITANNGNSAIHTVINQMINIESTVFDSSKAVEKLGDRSKEIGLIVETISGIASQTNLLALNAAIEAARAGEHGKGFAVVAEEVRKLAEQSHDATEQIACLIGEIQGETYTAVEAMHLGTKEVASGTEVVKLAKKSFDEIVTLVSEVSVQIREISDAIQQMSNNSELVVTSIKEVVAVSQNITGETQSISAATEEQSASMQEIASSSHALSKMADELQNAVIVFKI
ncbi:methyl-accepting chemotaxis protein [Heliophilum fasciatum]|uniref:Methyl-accepting chemotaxis sensory transducer n=1 Tax=Heliophilum fasciatum TaxID=35700 RepID=A0A4R2RBH9_9FIRM|nr:methyl-accepting chemotaxis protein [Heliophilum fasciatum]MCW2279476.1 methyl-accepting chemotaxis protein [Heliophilum fasciatum]TCP59704.1 methyl-accepting chemotaxis sensory transducer [Heliophilum fasciatum]